MIVQFIHQRDAKPAGRPFALCPQHAQVQRVPDHLALQVLSRDQGPPCDECQGLKYLPPGARP